MKNDGTCPECGEVIDVAMTSGIVTADNLDLKKLAGIDDEKLPWHFKLLVTLLVLYLGWRVIDLFA